MINIDSTIQSADTLSAREAMSLLGVKAQTLYAYASRGLLRRVGNGRQRRYVLEDLRRLQARQHARSGHGPVAAAALQFGDPVLDSSITGIDERGPRYRGLVAVDLARQGQSFEAVAELLWSGALPVSAPTWQRPTSPFPRTTPSTGSDAPRTFEQLLVSVAGLIAEAPQRYLRTREAELSLARSLILTLTLHIAAPPLGARGPAAPKPAARGSARGPAAPGPTRAGASGVAECLTVLCRGAPRKHAREALNVALVLLADHELNASSFAARVAASTDADLLPCLLTALATLSGPRHGGACDRVEALLDEAEGLPRPSDVIEQRVRRGDAVPGFGHPLYPAGDPRAALLLERTRALPGAGKRAQKALSLAATMEKQGLPATVDFGLVALARGLGMPKGLPSLLFAIGRSAGWVAHVLEQRESDAVLRPRARYVGA